MHVGNMAGRAQMLAAATPANRPHCADVAHNTRTCDAQAQFHASPHFVSPLAQHATGGSMADGTHMPRALSEPVGSDMVGAGQQQAQHSPYG